MLTLEQLGWDTEREKEFAPHRAQGLEPARVVIEDKHRFLVQTGKGGIPAQVSGKLLHRSCGANELPKVGDWVGLVLVPKESKGIIHAVLSRRTKLSRKAAGRETDEQILVTNVDIAFVVVSLDRTLNPKLLQRYLVMVLEGGIKPVVVLNKADLSEDILTNISDAERASREAPVIAVSAKSGQAIESLTQLIRPSETVVFIGTSGVGKSSLINRIYGEDVQATAEVREVDAKGRHTTTWRQMVILPQGGLVIDTPGMREFHMWAAGEGLEEAFGDIVALASQCHFRACSHTQEKKCAVLQALGAGQLSRERYESFLKLQRELDFLEDARRRRGVIERRRKTRVERRAFQRKKHPLDER